jgi:hypothetical protein
MTHFSDDALQPAEEIHDRQNRRRMPRIVESWSGGFVRLGLLSPHCVSILVGFGGIGSRILPRGDVHGVHTPGPGLQAGNLGRFLLSRKEDLCVYSVVSAGAYTDIDAPRGVQNGYYTLAALFLRSNHRHKAQGG